MDFNIYDDHLQKLNVTKEIVDEEQSSTKYGKRIFTKDYIQKYEGQFLYNNFHGQGKYTWISPDGNGYLIEDPYYANKIHGYSSIYYNNGGLYEGLFKLNKRYGPGIFTSENGLQDVGLWDGLSLIRLTCPIYKKHVPKLALTDFGKIKLLKYRKLVPVSYGDQIDDKATDILKYLNAPKHLIENSNLLYNEYVRHEDSLLFDKELYDELFFGQEDCYIDVISAKEIANQTPNATLTDHYSTNTDLTSPTNSAMDYLLNNDLQSLCECDICEPEEETKSAEELLNDRRNKLKAKYLNYGRDNCKWQTTKMHIASILAWNNEPHLMQMLRYCFRYRKMETSNVSFNVQSLLAGLRNHFNKPGTYEEVCRQFLINCSENNYIEIMQFSNDYYINPDLCDSFGNTGMMFAAARDCIKTLEILLSLGGNVDSLNDEGLTPLAMCLLRYIAVLSEVNNWEKAFVGGNFKMNHDEMNFVENWSPNFSLINLINCTKHFNVNYDIEEEDVLKEEYLADLTKELRTEQGKQAESTIEDVQIEKPQDYLFDFDCLRMNLSPKKIGKDMKNRRNKKIRKDKNTQKNKKTRNVKKNQEDKKQKRKDKSSKKTNKIEKVNKNKVQLINEEEDLKDRSKDVEISEDELKRIKLLQAIEHTINTLLRFGADPNIGEVPLPPLLLSIFTKKLDIIAGIIKNKAAINITTLEDNLTALHVLASLKPPKQEYVDIMRLLLENNANPNYRCSDFHWHEEKVIILNVKPENNRKNVSEKSSKATTNANPTSADVEILSSKRVLLSQPSITTMSFENLNGPASKSPLHIICLRYDYILDSDNFLNQMANLLLHYGADVNAYYLGHIPLTLAMLRGNVKLMETLLMNGANPNIKLDHNMGVPSTVLVLKRYEKLLPTEICETIYEVLYKYHVNPLKTLTNKDNAIEFMIKEHEVLKDKLANTTKGKKDKSGKKKQKKQKKVKKAGALQSNMEEIKNLLMETTKKVLEKHIKSKALSYLFLFIKEDVLEEEEEDDDENNILNVLSKYLSPNYCIKTFQLFIHSERIRVDDRTRYILLDIINLVKENPPKKGDSFQEDTEVLIASIDWKSVPNKKGYYDKYIELDKEETIYEVCYNCLTKQGKLLFPCPICGLIYFCSQKCNIANNKIKNNLHPCKVIFYNDEKAKYDDCIKNGIEYKPFSKLSNAKEIADEKKRIREKEELKQKLIEAMKRSRFDSKRKAPIGGKIDDYFERNAKFGKSSRRTKHDVDGYSADIISRGKASKRDKSAKDSEGSKRGGNKSPSTKDKIAKTAKDGTTQTHDILQKDKSKGKKSKGKLSRNEKRSIDAKDRSDGNKKRFGGSEERSGRSKKRFGGSKDRFGGSAKRSDGSKKKFSEGKKRSGGKKSKESSTKGGRKYTDKGKSSKSKFVTRNKSSAKELKGKGDYSGKSKTKADKESGDKSPVKQLFDDKQKDSTVIIGGTHKSDLIGQMGVFDLSKPSTLTLSHGFDTRNIDKFDRLPTRYQYLMIKLLQLFPDIDLSSLLLPYACYKDGELYYRFIENKYFCSTYSHV